MRRRKLFFVYPAAAIVLALLAGTVLAAMIRRPEVDAVDELRPNLPTRLMDDNGGELRTYAVENRILIEPGEIPPLLRDAVLAVEDAHFYEHGPIDPPAVVRSAITNIRQRRFAEGFSTITMQVAKNLFLTNEKTVRRKLSEISLAVELEKRFSKDQVLALYMNVSTNLGNGYYGFAAGARAYFGKDTGELTLAEAATLAGIPNSPERFNVYRKPDAVLKRRDHVLGRMLAEGRIDQASYDAARAEPLGVLPRPTRDAFAAHFNEEVRRTLADDFGSDTLYGGGLRVRTTLDPDVQRATEEALREHLAQLREKPGLDGLEGAAVVLETATGAVRALVGGYDFATSELNRATQSQRQVGSTFKPFVFGAALEDGFTPADTLFDGPVAFTGADGLESYSPRNDDRRYRGAITLREALEKSINVPAVKLFDLVGAQRVVDFAQRAGIRSELPPYPTLALGAASLRPLELVTAYAAIAGGGIRREPYLVETVTAPDGRVLRDQRTQSRAVQAMTSQVAGVLLGMLEGVARRGTAAGDLARLPLDVAGKTGTTNAAADVWFAGLLPRYTVVVWLGHDQPRPLGRGASGGRMALPVFRRLVERGLAEGWLLSEERFARPPGLVDTVVDAASGLLPQPGSERPTVKLAFIDGTEPERRLDDTWRQALAMPWYLQEPFYLAKEGERMPSQTDDWAAIRRSWQGR